jgi:hypothetical protein
MRRAALILAALLFWSAPALAQEGSNEPPDEFETIEDIIAFLEGFEGGPDDLQKAYENLKPAQRELVDENFESWSLEGGLSLMGGARLGDKTDTAFRMGVSIGQVWAMGDYDLPIYYAFIDIPGPWSLGWTAAVQTDNFGNVSAAPMLRWAYEYIGTTPMIDVGPALRLGDGDPAFGGKLDLGYGNILVQGYVATEYYSDNSLSVFAGVRIPWLLATLF